MHKRLGRWPLAGVWPAVAILVALELAPHGCAGQAKLTLRQAVESALENNLDVRMGMAAVDSAAAERRIARALPNPTVSGVPNSPYQYTASVAVPLITPARAFQSGAAARGYLASGYDLADIKRRVALQVGVQFYDVLLAERLAELARDRRDIVRQLLAADSARVRAGDAPERNLVKSALELARAEAEVEQAAAQVRAARIALQVTMGVAEPDTGLTVDGELRYDPNGLAADSLAAGAEARRPDVQAAEARVSQAERLRRLSRATLWPVPTVTVAYQPQGAFSEAKPWRFGDRVELGVGLQLPVWSWNGGQHARAEAAVQAAEAQVDRVRQTVRSEMTLARDQVIVTQRLAARYHDGLLVQAQTALEQSRYAYQAGATSLLDYLDAIATFSDTEADYARALRDYAVALVGFRSATGRELVTP